MKRALAYNRPLPASLNTTAAVAPNFPINIGQLVRFVFQRPYDGASVGFQFADLAAAQTMSTWTTMIAATDGTAMKYTPLFSNSKIGDPKVLETGSDSNLTYRGQPEFFGIGGSMLGCEFRAKDAPSLVSLDSCVQFSQQDSAGISNLSAYMVNQDGDVLAKGTQSGGVITNIEPINIFNWWYATQGTEGYATGSTVKSGLWLPPYWSDDMVIIPSTSTFDLRLLK